MFIPGLKWNQALAAAESASVSSTFGLCFCFSRSGQVAIKKARQANVWCPSYKEVDVVLIWKFLANIPIFSKLFLFGFVSQLNENL